MAVAVGALAEPPRTGVGRTGTALAVLAVLGGVGPDDAVTRVRTHHHPRAVETRG